MWASSFWQTRGALQLVKSPRVPDEFSPEYQENPLNMAAVASLDVI